MLREVVGSHMMFSFWKVSALRNDDRNLSPLTDGCCRHLEIIGKAQGLPLRTFRFVTFIFILHFKSLVVFCFSDVYFFFPCYCDRPGVYKSVLPFQLSGFSFSDPIFLGTYVLTTSPGPTFPIPSIMFAFRFYVLCCFIFFFFSR